MLNNSDHPNHTVLTRRLHAHLRWRNTNARDPDLLAAQRRERARVRSQRGRRWGIPAAQPARTQPHTTRAQTFVDRALDPALLLEASRASEGTSLPPPLSDDSGMADPAFESVVVEVGAALDRGRVDAALRDWPESVLRVKGVLRFNGHPDRLHVIHRVGRRWSIEEAPNGLDSSHSSKLVVIGLRGTLHHRDLTASLRSPRPAS